MNGTPSAFIICSLWLSGVSGCIGCTIGMGLMLWHQRRSIALPERIPDAQSESVSSTSPSSEEIKLLFSSLIKINSDVDARVGQHTVRIEEINQTLDSHISDNRELLVRTAKMLVAANKQLKTDLESTKSELQDQRELVDSFKMESLTDALTQLSNRRAFEAEINQYLEQFRRENTVFSLLLIDIDHFKQINDVHGHLNGDQVLATVAQCLKSNLDVPAFVSRYGGEEFAVILPETAQKRASKVAELLRRAVENCSHVLSGTKVNCTVSIGLTESVNEDTRSRLIERADQALFAAKNAGRNRCLHDQECPIEKAISSSGTCRGNSDRKRIATAS